MDWAWMKQEVAVSGYTPRSNTPEIATASVTDLAQKCHNSSL